MMCHDFADPSLKGNRVEAAGSRFRLFEPRESSPPTHCRSLARRARQDGDLSTPLNAPPLSSRSPPHLPIRIPADLGWSHPCQ